MNYTTDISTRNKLTVYYVKIKLIISLINYDYKNVLGFVKINFNVT
jgi:hypothetical protein